MTFRLKPDRLPGLPFGAAVIAFFFLILVNQVRPSPASAAPSGLILVVEKIGSGIYGFSGSGVPGSPLNSGVVGECVWIYDATNAKQVAAGTCDEQNPGKFRVELPPGHYVVRGPGGNKPVEVKTGAWTQVDSVGSLGGY